MNRDLESAIFIKNMRYAVIYIAREKSATGRKLSYKA